MHRRFGQVVTLVGVGVLATAAIGVTAPGAGAATPFPPGNTTINMSGTISVTVGSTLTPTPFTFTGAQLKNGTSDGAGTITFTKSNVTFPVISTTVSTIKSLLTVTPTSNFVAKINTTTGLMTLSGSIMNNIQVGLAPPAGTGVIATNCLLGPITLNQSSATVGGKKYTPSGNTATATVVDRTFAVPVATNGGGTLGCASFVPLINNATNGLALPIIKGDTSVRHARFALSNLTIFPPGVAVPTTTSTTTTTTTTTTTVAPTTTIAPVRATALPRTGSSSSGPLALVGVALVGGGLALVRPGRKRRTERS